MRRGDGVVSWRFGREGNLREFGKAGTGEAIADHRNGKVRRAAEDLPGSGCRGAPIAITLRNRKHLFEGERNRTGFLRLDR